MTQKQLADRLELSQPRLSKILAGKLQVSPTLAVHLETKSSIGRMHWLYDSPEDLKKRIDERFGVVEKGKPCEY